MLDERITRTYRFRIPKYRTGYRERTNWSAVKVIDVLPLVVIAAKMPGNAGGLWIAGFWLSVAWLVGRVAVRAWRRGGECAERGWHDPWEAAPGVWRCWHCDQDLSTEETVLAVRRHVISEAGGATPQHPQAAYSDRH